MFKIYSLENQQELSSIEWHLKCFETFCQIEVEYCSFLILVSYYLILIMSRNRQWIVHLKIMNFVRESVCCWQTGNFQAVQFFFMAFFRFWYFVEIWLVEGPLVSIEMACSHAEVVFNDSILRAHILPCCRNHTFNRNSFVAKYTFCL